MPLSTEQRIELLKKAREAKARKKAEADALKPVPVRGRPAKKNEEKTLNLVEDNKVNDEEIDAIIDEPVREPVREPVKVPKRTLKTKKPQSEIEEEPEIVEEIEVKKIKKPKKRIVRKIIKEQYDSSSTEEEYEEVIYQAPKHRPRVAQSKPVEKPPELPAPREPEVRKSGFNLFSY